MQNKQDHIVSKENKILFFSYWYPNKNNQNSAIFVKRHAHAIKHENPAIIILVLTIIYGNAIFKKTNHVFIDEEGIETHQIYIESKFYKLIYMLLPLHYMYLKSYINNHLHSNFKFTIIHSNVLFPCGIVGYWLAKKYKCKHIITEHWSKLNRFFKRSVYRKQGEKALNQAHAITCVSAALSDTVKTYTFNNSVSIVPNVVSASHFYLDEGIEKNKMLTFIAVAHWAPPKNPFYFLEALQLLQPEIPPFKIVLVGTGTQLGEIKHKKYGFEIDYKGNLSATELRQELSKSHVFLHGSDFETFSVVIIEALMCGLPCIVSPVGIAKDVINNNNGFIAGNTVSEWKQAIKECTGKTYNYQAIAQGLNTKFGLENVGRMFTTVYKSLS